MTTDTRIGIGIVHCQSAHGSTDIGYTPVFKSDKGKWSSIIDDTGTVFSYVKIDYDTILRMIHFAKDGEGWYMCSMKRIPGRDEEYRASWVYFPASLDLTKKEIKSIIEVAESQIKQKEYDESILQDVIHKYQKVNVDNPLYYIPSTQQGFAFRDTSGNINISDLYENIYQKEFAQYEWVILMDRALVSLKGNSVEDISDRNIIESFVIRPTSNELGFTPYLNGAEFRSPVRIMDGEWLLVEFRKYGYVPIEKRVRTQADFTIYAQECKRYFKKNQFVAYDSKTNKHISSAIIEPINAKEDKDTWIFAEQDIENASFKVKADGYNEDSFVIDLRKKSLNDEIPLPLEPEVHEYLFILPLDKSIVKDEDSAEIVIRSQYVIRDSPVKGYCCVGIPRDGRVQNKLTAVQNAPKTPIYPVSDGGLEIGVKGRGRKPSPILKYVKYIVFSTGIAIILAVVIYLLVISVRKDWGDNNYSNGCPVETVDDRKDSASVETQGDNVAADAPERQWGKAYEYLQNSTIKIYKDSLERFEDLKGLYDMVNSYRFNDYRNYIDEHSHKNEILTINVWKKLYDNSKAIGSNKNGLYNTPEAEQSITFRYYFDKVNAKTKPEASPTSKEQKEKDGNLGNGQDESI